MTKVFGISATLVLLFALITSSPLKAELNTQSLKKLKAASLNCDVISFQDFMSQGTYSKVNAFELQLQKLNKIVDSIQQKAKQKFDPGVKRTSKGIKIPISGKDPRWRTLFGPQWDVIIETYPNGPFHFNINAYMAWEQECKVIQKFQACLEDNSFCSEYQVEGSVIRIAKQNDSWKIVYDLPVEKEKQSNKIKTMIINLAIWADNYLTLHNDTPPNDDFKFQFASDYFAEMRQFLSELKSQ